MWAKYGSWRANPGYRTSANGSWAVRPQMQSEFAWVLGCRPLEADECTNRQGYGHCEYLLGRRITISGSHRRPLRNIGDVLNKDG